MDIRLSHGFGIELGGMLTLQHPGKAFNGPDGSLEVMGHGIRKGFQLLVGGLQLGGPLPHPLFQLFVDHLEFFFRLPASTFIDFISVDIGQ
jgi:hypothetical protein